MAFNFSSGSTGSDDDGDYDGGRAIIDWDIIRWDNSTCLNESGDSGDVIDINFDECIPFRNSALYQDSSWLLTLGYFVSALIFIPMSLKDLKVRYINIFNAYYTLLPFVDELTIIIGAINRKTLRFK